MGKREKIKTVLAELQTYDSVDDALDCIEQIMNERDDLELLLRNTTELMHTLMCRLCDSGTCQWYQESGMEHSWSRKYHKQWLAYTKDKLAELEIPLERAAEAMGKLGVLIKAVNDADIEVRELLKMYLENDVFDV